MDQCVYAWGGTPYMDQCRYAWGGGVLPILTSVCMPGGGGGGYSLYGPV